MSREKLIELFNKREPINVTLAIITHPSCHLDEFGSIFLLQDTDEGKRIFPGIENATIGFQTETYLRNNGFLGFHGFIKALESGYLIIGLGGGPFDEHSDRQKKISCIELVKRYLQLYDSKETRTIYKPLIDFINFEDNNGDNLVENLNRANPGRLLAKNESNVLLNLNLGMLAQNIKKGWEVAITDYDTSQLCGMVIKFLKNEIDQRKLFLQACNEYQSSEKQIVELPNNHVMVIIKSDNPLMVRAVRQRARKVTGGKDLGITVVYKSTGQFVIYPNNGFADKMIEVAKILRQEISFKKTGRGIAFEKLGEYGTIKEVVELYIDENMKIIMNGSKTDPDVPGLIKEGMLTIHDIIKAVTFGVDDSQFDKKFSHHCKEGVCAKNIDPGVKCKTFCYNLNRCQNVIENSSTSVKPLKVLEKIEV